MLHGVLLGSYDKKNDSDNRYDITLTMGNNYGSPDGFIFVDDLNIRNK